MSLKHAWLLGLYFDDGAPPWPNNYISVASSWLVFSSILFRFVCVWDIGKPHIIFKPHYCKCGRL